MLWLKPLIYIWINYYMSLRLCKRFHRISRMYCLFFDCISMILCLHNVGCRILIIDMLTKNTCFSCSQKCNNTTRLHTNIIQVGGQDSYKTNQPTFFFVNVNSNSTVWQLFSSCVVFFISNFLNLAFCFVRFYGNHF